MSQQHINVGTSPNDGTGDTLRDSQIKAEANFSELYGMGFDPATHDLDEFLNAGTDPFVQQSELDGYIPLSGTETGEPVTGDIEFDSGTKIFRGITDFQSDGDAFNSTGFKGGVSKEVFIGVNEGEDDFDVSNYTDSNNYSRVTGNGFEKKSGGYITQILPETYRVSIIGTDPTFKGIDLNSDYSANIDDFCLAQKIYVDAEIASAIGGIGASEPPITGTTNVDFWSGAKTFINFATTALNTLLTGFTGTAGTVTSADSILVAINKLVGNQALKANLASPSMTGSPTINGFAVAKILAKDGAASSAVTGTTSQTIFKAYLIPANTLAADDVIHVPSFKMEKTGTAGTITMRLSLNTVGSLSGSPVTIATFIPGATAVFGKLRRSFTITGSTLKGYSFTTASPDDNTTTTVLSSTSFNPAVDNYIITSGQLASAADSVIQREFLMN